MNNVYLEILFNNAKYFDESGDMISKARAEIDALVAAAVLAEREANCAAMCEQCAAGIQAVQGSKESWGGRYVHWLNSERRYIGCSASKIRARQDGAK